MELVPPDAVVPPQLLVDIFEGWGFAPLRFPNGNVTFVMNSLGSDVLFPPNVDTTMPEVPLDDFLEQARRAEIDPHAILEELRKKGFKV